MPGRQWYMEWQISAKKKNSDSEERTTPNYLDESYANLTQAMKHRYNIIIGSSWLVTCCICCHDRQWNGVRWRGWRYIVEKLLEDSHFTVYKQKLSILLFSSRNADLEDGQHSTFHLIPPKMKHWCSC